MAWKKAKDNQPAVGKPRVVGEAGEQRWVDDDGDTVYATSASDFPHTAPPTDFLGIPSAPPAEGSLHSLLQRALNDLAAIKIRLGI